MDATIEQRLDILDEKLNRLLKAIRSEKKKDKPQMGTIKDLKKIFPGINDTATYRLRIKYPQYCEKIEGRKRPCYIYNLTEFLKLTA